METVFDPGRHQHLCLSRAPTSSERVADTPVSSRGRLTQAQRVQPELGGVSPNGLQIPPESFSHGAITNILIGGYQLTRILTFRNVSRKQIPRIWRNLKLVRYFLRSLTGHARLESPEKTTSSPRRSWSFFLLGNYFLPSLFFRLSLALR